MSTRIIEPLTSRCSKFRFKPLANKIQEERLLEICEKENLKYTKEVREEDSYEQLTDKLSGRMNAARKAVLQCPPGFPV